MQAIKWKDNKFLLSKHFCVSTASRVGVGNIAGIAIAVVLGGPGAIFWMWIIAILGSATGFVESTLAQFTKYLVLIAMAILVALLITLIMHFIALNSCILCYLNQRYLWTYLQFCTVQYNFLIFTNCI